MKFPFFKLTEKCGETEEKKLFTSTPPSSSAWTNQPSLVTELSINNPISRQNFIYYLISTCHYHKKMFSASWARQARVSPVRKAAGHTNEPYKQHLFWNIFALRPNMMKPPDSPPPLPRRWMALPKCDLAVLIKWFSTLNQPFPL